MVVLAVNTWDEPKDTLAEFARENKLKQRILLNGSDVGRKYGVAAIPTNVWIDPQGTMVDAALGFDGPEQLEAKTRKLISATH